MTKTRVATRKYLGGFLRLCGIWMVIATLTIVSTTFPEPAFGQTETPTELSEHDREKLRAFVSLWAQKPEKIDRDLSIEEQSFKDFLAVWNDNEFHMTRQEALTKYQQAVKHSPTPLTEARLKIATEAVRYFTDQDGTSMLVGVEEHPESQPFSVLDIFSDKEKNEMDASNKSYAYLLDADLHLIHGRYREAWKSYGEVLYLTSNQIKNPTGILFKLSDLETTLYALEGNYSKALNAAVTHISISIKNGEIHDGISPIHNTILAFVMANQLSEINDLIPVMLSSVAESRASDRFYANHLAGRVFLDLGKYEQAIPYLINAVKYADIPRKKSFPLARLYTAHAATGQFDKATEYLNAHNQLFEANPTWNMNPSTRLHLAQGDYFMALQLGESEIKKAQAELNAQKVAYERHKQDRIRKFSSYKTEAYEVMLARQKEDMSRVSFRETQADFVNKIILFISIPLLLALAALLFLSLRNNKAVHSAKMKAETASRIKGQFLNLIGHNTRNSLSAIESMVQALKTSSVSLEHLPTVQVIGSQATTLNKAITDLIFSARMISGDRQVKLSSFNAYEYKNRMLPIWTQAIGKRNVQVIFNITPDLPLFLVDPLYLQTAVEHLVEEAIPKTRVGSIDIEFALQQSLRGQMLRVTVEDTGEGLTEADQEAIHEFFEVDATGISVVDFEQTIGYSVSRSAVEVMGGTLALTSEIGKGTRASFAVPIKSAAANDMGRLKDNILRSKDIN